MSPSFVRAEERTKIPTRANQSGCRAFPIENRGREIETANIARIGGVNIAGVAKNHRVGGDPELLSQL